MSERAIKWVFNNSPYSGSTRLVHLAIAHAVDDSDRHLLHAKAEELAQKAGCSIRTVYESQEIMAFEGCLEIINGRGAPRRLKEYRFLMPQWATSVIDPERGPEFELYSSTVQLTFESLQALVKNLHSIQESLALGDVESAERELIVTRHVIDVAQLTTVDSITKREPLPDVRLEFISVVEDLRKLWAPEISEETTNTSEH